MSRQSTAFDNSFPIPLRPKQASRDSAAQIDEVATRKELEEALREGEEFNRRLLDSSSDCIQVLDLDFRLMYMNPSGISVMEIDEFSSCRGADWTSFWDSGDRPAVVSALENASAGDRGSFHGFCATMKGSPKWWDVIVNPVKDAEGKVVRLLACARDVTEHKQAGEALKEAHCRLEDQIQTRTSELQHEVVDRRRAEDNLRELTGRLLSMRDDEQRRIARELHDSAGQILTAATMEIAIVDREAQKLSPQAAKAAAEVGILLQDALREIRTISHLLHPPLLDEAGLTSAVRWYAEGFAERSKINVELDLAEDVGRLSRELETAIFRIIQESLTNIHRHSQSETARIRLLLSADKVRVEIEDNGNGIGADDLATLQTQSSRGVGIRGMRERVRQLGGNLEIASKPRGTRVAATFPIASPGGERRPSDR